MFLFFICIVYEGTCKWSYKPDCPVKVIMKYNHVFVTVYTCVCTDSITLLSIQTSLLVYFSTSGFGLAVSLPG